MKKSILFSISLFTTVCLAVSTAQVSAQKSDEVAIKNAIQNESSTYFHKNYDGWANTWTHDTANYIIGIGPAGYGETKGWNAINALFTQYIKNLPVRTDAEIAPHLNFTDFQIYVNGNTATASFTDNYKMSTRESYTMVKQKGAWKILNITRLNSANYTMMRTFSLMKTFEGKWVLDGEGTREPSNGGKLNEASFSLRETPYGLEQISRFINSNPKGKSVAIPPALEYFIPDYSTGTVFYLVVDKGLLGQTYTQTGTVTSDGMNSFTVTVMYPDKPTAVKSEYTVSLQNGKWHQVGKNFDREGNQTETDILDMRRL